MELRWFIAVMTLLLVACPASAQELGIGISPGELWLGDDAGISCWFSQEPEGQAIVWADVTEPISLRITGFSRVNSTHFSTAYRPPVIGQYSLSCSNGSLESPERGFSVSDLEAEIVQSPGQAFTDQGIQLHARVTKKGGSAVQLKSGVTFSLTLDGAELGISGFPYYYKDHWVIDTGGLEGFGTGSYSLRLSASYHGREAWDEADVYVLEPLDFRIDSVSPDELHGGENVSVSLVAAYHNSSVLSASVIEASLDGEGLTIERASSGFQFVCPELEPEPHTLEVSLDYGGIHASDSRPIYYMIPVHGEIRNAGGGGVSANMRFMGDGWQKSVKTNVNGAFVLNVPAGSYDLEMSFPAGIFVTVEGLDIYSELKDFVRFDTFTAGEIEGISVAKAFALEFSPGFGKMVIRAEYDGAAVSDESDLMVYTCEDWNLDSRACSGSWEELDFEIDAMQNEVEFEPGHLSGFVVGSRGELKMEASLDREEYVTGQKIGLTGVVRDGNGKAVADAKVNYYITGGADGYVKTNGNGIFSASIAVPSNGGDYSMTLRASRGFCKQDAKSIDFTVLTFKEFTIIPPLRVDVSEGSEARPEVVIINTGQEVLEDFSINLSGIPGEWYQAEPEKWDSISPDEERKVLLTIRPDSPDREIYTVGIDVSCDQASRSESFVMYVKPLMESKEGESVETNASGSEYASPFDSVTLYLVGSYESVINTLSLIASCGIILIIVRRIRRRPGGRAWIVALLESVKSEVMKAGSRTTRAKSRSPGSGRENKAPVKRNPHGHIEVEI